MHAGQRLHSVVQDPVAGSAGDVDDVPDVVVGDDADWGLHMPVIRDA